MAVAASCPHLTLYEGEKEETQGEHFSHRVPEQPPGADLRKTRSLPSRRAAEMNYYFQLPLVQINNLFREDKEIILLSAIVKSSWAVMDDQKESKLSFTLECIWIDCSSILNKHTRNTQIM